jgi:5,10-methylenetetrahydromethanopterin reductase
VEGSAGAGAIGAAAHTVGRGPGDWRREGDERAVRLSIGCIPRDYEYYPTWVRAAEETGFHEVGTGDSSALWTDPFVTLAVAATHSTRVRLAVTGTNPVTRHPIAAAGALESVQMLSGGRCRYALGSGDSSVATIGRQRQTLAEVERYGRTVQDLCAGRVVDDDGHPLHLRWARLPVPVHLCADGPRTQVLAGRFADGAVLYNGITEEVVKSSIEHVATGARTAGRSLDDVELSWIVVFHMTDDVEQGIDAIKFSLAGTANRAFRHSLVDKLVPEDLHSGFRGLQSEYQSSHHQQLGDHHWNASLVDKYGLTRYLASRFAIVGPAEHCAERLREIGSYGVTNVTLSLLSQDLPAQVETMRRLSDEVFPHLDVG